MIERDVEFIYEVGTLRNVQRTWKYFTNADFANVTEHSFRVCWLALILSMNETRPIDRERLLAMALFHDVPEIRVGDINYFMKKYVKRDEARAVQDALEGTSLEKYLLSIWEEWQQGTSTESRIVKDADRLDCEFELNEQIQRGQLLAKTFQEEGAPLQNNLHTEYAKRLYHKARGRSVFSWFLHSLRDRVKELLNGN